MPIKRKMRLCHSKSKLLFVSLRTYPNYSMKYNGCMLVRKSLQNDEESGIIISLKVALWLDVVFVNIFELVLSSGVFQLCLIKTNVL